MKNKIIKTFSKIDSNGGTLLTPFVVSKEKKTLYLHIAKTGGSTITKVLRNHKLDDNFLTNKKLSYKNKRLYFEDIVDHWDSYYKFTFVRNKYDQLVSHWHYDGHPGGTFENFIKNIVSVDKELYGFWINQYDLTVIDNKSIFNFVGRHDNFDKDFQKVLNNIGIKTYNKRTRENVGKYNKKIHFSKYYNEETKEIVYNKFKQEIDYFGFTLKED